MLFRKVHRIGSDMIWGESQIRSCDCTCRKYTVCSINLFCCTYRVYTIYIPRFTLCRFFFSGVTSFEHHPNTLTSTLSLVEKLTKKSCFTKRSAFKHSLRAMGSRGKTARNVGQPLSKQSPRLIKNPHQFIIQAALNRGKLLAFNLTHSHPDHECLDSNRMRMRLPFPFTSFDLILPSQLYVTEAKWGRRE